MRQVVDAVSGVLRFEHHRALMNEVPSQGRMYTVDVLFAIEIRFFKDEELTMLSRSRSGKSGMSISDLNVGKWDAASKEAYSIRVRNKHKSLKLCNTT